MVDASIIVQACIDAGELGPLTRQKLVAPPIMGSEVVATLRQMRYRHDISAELATIALDAFVALDYTVERPDGLWLTATQICERLGWAKTYDAEYVALSAMTGYPLVTLDAGLAQGARRIATIVGPRQLT